MRKELKLHAVDLAAGQNSLRIPLTYKQAPQRPAAELWVGAIDCELNSDDSNKTFVEVEDEGQETVDGRWIFGKKYIERNELERCKARLVATGFTQIHGINYDDTYSPVAARYDSLRLIY